MLTPTVVSGSRAQAIEKIAGFVSVEPPPYLRGHRLKRNPGIKGSILAANYVLVAWRERGRKEASPCHINETQGSLGNLPARPLLRDLDSTSNDAFTPHVK